MPSRTFSKECGDDTCKYGDVAVLILPKNAVIGFFRDGQDGYYTNLEKSSSSKSQLPKPARSSSFKSSEMIVDCSPFGKSPPFAPGPVAPSGRFSMYGGRNLPKICISSLSMIPGR